MTKAKINKAIKHLGLTIQGNRDGYFYFLNQDGNQVGESVMIPYLNCQTLEDWVADAENCKGMTNKQAVKQIKWNDLKFETHHFGEGVQCKVKFENGEWCSIIGGETSFYGDGVHSFEIYSSITKKTSRGVKGWLSKVQVLRHLNYLKNKKIK